MLRGYRYQFLILIITIEEVVLLNMGVADRCLVGERIVTDFNPRSFKGYQRRKSFIWVGHICSLLHVGRWRYYLLVIHLLLFREVHVDYV